MKDLDNHVKIEGVLVPKQWKTNEGFLGCFFFFLKLYVYFLFSQLSHVLTYQNELRLHFLAELIR